MYKGRGGAELGLIKHFSTPKLNIIRLIGPKGPTGQMYYLPYPRSTSGALASQARQSGATGHTPQPDSVHFLEGVQPWPWGRESALPAPTCASLP